ncbi:MAG: methyltransferase domain-containing protein [Candidatus Pacebacteria bacterium]|nr:methyltransferase domain-containing protein [Candidatus Paceibacterota bacterium]
MAYTLEQIKNLSRIMDVDEEIIPLLSFVRPEGQILNGMGKNLPQILDELNIKKGMVVLDMPCGQGGVSIPLAERYGVKVIGYDIIPDYVRYANELAKRKRLSRLCDFKVGDIQEIARQKDICDVLLWVAPPHVFGRSKSTIKALRNLVKNDGLIVIGDAYLLSNTESNDDLRDYETLSNTNKGYTAFGDEIIEFKDFKKSLWAEDYAYTERIYNEALNKMESQDDRIKFKKVIDSLDDKKQRDEEALGVALWVIKVKK